MKSCNRAHQTHRRRSLPASLLMALGTLGGTSAGMAADHFAVGDFKNDGYDDLIVGVPYEDVGTRVNAGAVSLFDGTGSGLSAEPAQQLHQDTGALGSRAAIPDQAEAWDHFGKVLAVGDFDNDGYDDAAIAAPREALGQNNAQEHAGVVHILYGSGQGLHGPRNSVLSPELFYPSDQLSGKYFGGALAAGDLNGDGYDDLAVGIPGAPDYTRAEGKMMKFSGVVAVFFGGTGGLTDTQPFRGDLLMQSKPYIPAEPELGDNFGSELVVEDFDSDGYADLAIGIDREDVGSTFDAGAVVVVYGRAGRFDAEGTRGTLLQDVRAEREDRFGLSLAAGDFDGNGYSDLAVGHPYEDGGAQNSGAVSVIFSSNLGLDGTQRAYWVQGQGVDREERDDYFGSSLAAGDFTGDGIDDLAVGTPFENQERGPDLPSHSTGQVTVLYGSTSGLVLTDRSDWHQDKPGVPSSRASSDYFGHALVVGHFNDDRFGDLIVGVPGEDMFLPDGLGQKDAGMAHLFYGTDAGLSTSSALGGSVISEPLRLNGAGRAETQDGFGGEPPLNFVF